MARRSNEVGNDKSKLKVLVEILGIQKLPKVKREFLYHFENLLCSFLQFCSFNTFSFLQSVKSMPESFDSMSNFFACDSLASCWMKVDKDLCFDDTPAYCVTHASFVVLCQYMIMLKYTDNCKVVKMWFGFD